jgi:glycosyltransferase 2 family protein
LRWALVLDSTRLARSIHKTRSKAVSNSAKLFITLALLYFILRNVDVDQIIATVRSANVLLLALQCVLYPLGLLIASVRLKYILTGYGMAMKLLPLFDLNWIGGFFNNFLPSSVGGDLYRIVWLNRLYPHMPAQVVAAVLLDRGIALLAMMLIAGVASVSFVRELISSTWSIVTIYSVAFSVVGGSFFVLFADHQLHLKFTSRFATANKIINGFNVLLSYPDKRALLMSLVMSFLFIALNILAYYFLFFAFNTHVSLLALLFVIPLVSLAGLIPVSINAIGVTEGAAMLLFSQFGFAPELILSIFLAGRVLLLLCSATGGIAFLLTREVVPAAPR